VTEICATIIYSSPSVAVDNNYVVELLVASSQSAIPTAARIIVFIVPAGTERFTFCDAVLSLNITSEDIVAFRVTQEINEEYRATAAAICDRNLI
jgi:hypothetical protein